MSLPEQYRPVFFSKAIEMGDDGKERIVMKRVSLSKMEWICLLEFIFEKKPNGIDLCRVSLDLGYTVKFLQRSVYTLIKWLIRQILQYLVPLLIMMAF